LEKGRADTDAENIKCDAENAELKVRVAKLEQDSSVVDEQSQDAEDRKVFLLRGFAGGASSKKLQRESTEDDSMDVFLIEQHKKGDSEEIRQRNWEKKLQHESTVQETPSVSQDTTSVTSHERKA
jgi:hypothetical protein